MLIVCGSFPFSQLCLDLMELHSESYFLWFTYLCGRRLFTGWLLKWYNCTMQIFLKPSILVVLSGKKESLASWGLCLLGVDILPPSGCEVSELVRALEK